MTNAIVLGGGGPVGIAWECGLLETLFPDKHDLHGIDEVIGTSAGSVVGAALTGGVPLRDLVGAMTSRASLSRDVTSVDLAAMQTAVTRATATAASATEAMLAIGRLAASSETMSEDEFLAQTVFRELISVPWPESLRTTAIDIATGALRVWGPADGVDVLRAAAASCAIPAVYPPVTIGGSRFMDGGMSSPLNAHLAAGHDTVVIISCFSPDESDSSPLAAATTQQRDELGALRRSGSRVFLVQPDEEFSALSGRGAAVLDLERVPQAFDAGLRLGSVLRPQFVDFP